MAAQRPQPVRRRPGAAATSPARPKVLNDSQFADAGLGDLTAYDCVFLCDVPRLTPAEVRRLETHLRRGGGVVFCLGDQVDLGSLQRLLYRNGKGILPARLVGSKQAAGDRTFSFHAARTTATGAAAGGLRRDRRPGQPAGRRASASTSRPSRPPRRPRKVLCFTPVPLPARKAGAGRHARRRAGGDRVAAAAAAIAGDNPRRPIAAGRRYRGRVVLITTPSTWTGTPGPPRPASCALMQELLHFAVAGRLREQAVAVGDPLEEFLPPAAPASMCHHARRRTAQRNHTHPGPGRGQRPALGRHRRQRRLPGRHRPATRRSTFRRQRARRPPTAQQAARAT